MNKKQATPMADRPIIINKTLSTLNTDGRALDARQAPTSLLSIPQVYEFNVAKCTRRASSYSGSPVPRSGPVDL
jgi:hypothetical protein